RGSPQPKTKKKGPGSFRLTGSIVIFPDAIQLPRLGRLRLTKHGYLPTTATRGTPGVRVLSATVCEQAGHWYVSVQLDQDHTAAAIHSGPPVVGADLGVTRLATLSDGTKIPNPRHLKCRIKKLTLHGGSSPRGAQANRLMG